MVRAATAASVISGPERGRASNESPTHTESNPLAFDVTAASTSRPTSPPAHSTTSLDGSNKPIFVPMISIIAVADSGVSGVRA